MAYTPISNTVPQYSALASGTSASGYYLKFYADGTTTPISMATDSTGGTLLAKCELDGLGYPTTDGSAIFIPHIDQTYKLALYENATDADNNTLASAVWAVDDLEPTIGGQAADYVTVSSLAASSGAGLVGYTQGGTLSTNTTVEQRLRRVVYAEDFGVDGTASAADANAWQAAVDYCTGTEGVQLKATSGKTYLFDPENNKPGVVGAAILITPEEGESFFFDGANSTFKFVGGLTEADLAWHMFSVFMGTTAGITNQNAEQVIFENMVIDGNYRGQAQTVNYGQRSSVKVQVLGQDGNRLKLIKFRNIVQIDPCADTLSIGLGGTSSTTDGEAPINNCVIDTFHAGKRDSVRAAIQLGQSVGRTNISNVTKDKALGSESNAIETEPTTIDDQKVTVNITNCFIDDIELGGDQGNEDLFHANLTNCVLDGFLLFTRCNLSASNCQFPFSTSNAMRYKQARFNNCKFIHSTYDDGGVQNPRTLNLLPEDTSTTSSLWYESNCEHVIDTTNGAVDPTAIDAAIEGTLIASADHLNHEVRLDGCIFDSAFPRTVQGYRTGLLRTNNCILAGTDLAVQCGSDATRAGSWYSTNDDFTNVTGDNFNFIATGTTAEVRLDGGIWDTLSFAGSNVTNISAGIKQSSRVIQSSVAPTGGGAIGDIVKLDSAAYAAAASTDDVAWSCVSAHPTAATFISTLTKP